MTYKRFEDILGKENIEKFATQSGILDEYKKLCAELDDLNDQACKTFNVELSLADLLVSVSAGVICGGVNGCFKSFVPEHGTVKHKHGTTRTAVDYKVAKPENVKGSVQRLHRQIGPGHDIGRFKEALDLMAGETNDFPLWGKNASDWTGGILHSGNMAISEFLNSGGFNIPSDPKAELMNHLLIDFFTKTSLPLPFTSYIADSNQSLAKIMLAMYDKGLNLKNFVGNTSSVLLLQTITHGYSFLFKAMPNSNFVEDSKTISNVGNAINNLIQQNKLYTHSNEFHVIQMIAHGSSVLVDTLITTGSQNYAGLLALNYGSLLLFAKHTIQYIISGCKHYKEISSQINFINEDINKLNDKWYNGFKNNLVELAVSDGFIETFNPLSIENRHADVMGVTDKIHAHIDSKKKLRDEMKEWDI